MKLGAVFPHNEIGTDPGAIKAYAQGLESLGVDHLLIYDHVLGVDPNRPGGWRGPYDKDVAFHEPFTTYAYLAAVTERIKLVTAVIILPQRQTALVAKQAAEVALLSNNRLRLGVGTGWNAVEYEALDEDFTTRGRRQAEQVRLLRRFWEEDSFTYRGEFDRVTHAGINPRPTKPIPIWFGGAAAPLLKRCAELGDGWMPLGGANAQAQACIEALQAHRRAVGLEWAGFGIQAQAQFAGGTPERWATHAGKWRAMGATHLAVATHYAGPCDADGHLARVAAYLEAVGGTD